MATDKSVLKIEKLKESIRCKVVNFLLLESGERCGTHRIFLTCTWESFRGTALSPTAQGIPKCKVYVCEGIRESIALETGRTTDAKTEAGEDGRC